MEGILGGGSGYQIYRRANAPELSLCREIGKIFRGCNPEVDDDTIRTNPRDCTVMFDIVDRDMDDIPTDTHRVAVCKNGTFNITVDGKLVPQDSEQFIQASELLQQFFRIEP